MPRAGRIDQRNPVNWRHPLNTGLRLWTGDVPGWSGGTSYKDISRRNLGSGVLQGTNAGLVGGSSLLVNTPYGRGVSFNSSGLGYVNFGNICTGVGSQNLVISFWFNKVTHTTSFSNLWGPTRWSSSAATSEYAVVIGNGTSGNTDSVGLAVSNGSTMTEIDTTTTYALNAWHWVWCAKVGTSMLVFVDGVLSASGTGPATLGSGAANLLLGSAAPGTFRPQASFAHLRIRIGGPSVGVEDAKAEYAQALRSFPLLYTRQAAIFGITASGTSIFSDLQCPVEYLSTTSKNSNQPIEYKSTIVSSNQSYIEYKGTNTLSSKSPIEWNSGSLVSGNNYVEWLSTRLKNSNQFIEYLAGRTVSSIDPVEWTGAIDIVTDSRQPLEWKSTLAKSSTQPVEYISSLFKNSSQPIEYTSSRINNVQSPIEWLKTSNPSIICPIEWLGTNTVVTNSQQPLEWISTIHKNSNNYIEYNTLIKSDKLQPTEWVTSLKLSNIQYVEWTGAAATQIFSNIVCPIEWIVLSPFDEQIGYWALQSNIGYWSEPTLSPNNVQSQILNPIVIGQDWPYSFQGPADPTGWTVVFTIFPKGQAPISQTCMCTSTNNSISTSLLHVQTALFTHSENGIPYRLVRVDNGNIAVLTQGYVPVLTADGGGILPP